MRDAIFIVAIWVFLSYSSPSYAASSPRSPSGRKTKSPGLSGFPSEDSLDSPSPRTSPRFKRTRSVRINEDVSFHWLDDSEPQIDFAAMMSLKPSYETMGPLEPTCELVRPVATRAGIKGSPQSIVATPTTPEIPRPILKIRVPLSRVHPTTSHLFQSGTINDLKAFYDRGIQLSLPEPAITDIFKHLVDSSQFGKLKVIYERDRLKLTEFILKSGELSSEAILMLASQVFSKSAEQDLLDLQESTRDYSTIGLRVAFYLFAVYFDPQEVYNIITSLLDAGEANHVLTKEIISQYNRKPECVVPLLIFAIQKGLEFRTIVEFEPTEVDRLDSENCSIIYHAAAEGNLDVLEFFNGQMERRELAGSSPLIGAAKNNRDDSLKFFLEDSNWLFTEKDYEDAAFTAAICNNFSFFKLILNAGKVDLYSYRGDLTFLSAALRHGSLGFAKLLVERLDYSVNFVGEDPINSEGHALVYVLEKYSFSEMFLKRGASRNIKVYIEDEDSEDQERLVSLDEYLLLKKDTKLMKLLEKYPSHLIA